MRGGGNGYSFCKKGFFYFFHFIADAFYFVAEIIIRFWIGFLILASIRSVKYYLFSD
jgi:hypothetical protein